MTVIAHDVRRPSTRSGVGLGLLSAASFGMSGSLAKPLLESGWTPGAAVTARVLVAGVVLVVPAVMSLRGRWGLLVRNLRLIIGYALAAVAGCQLAYFNAVEHLDVSVALLIEYTSPVAVVGWMWFRHGQRPGRLTFAGALVAAFGLVLVLDLFSGTRLSGVGVVWALTAMLGAAVYWVISGGESDLPGLVLAAGGLLLGGVALLLAGLVGIVPFDASTSDVTLDGTSLAWWLPVLGLGVITAALAYVLGIAASRRLGARLASFVGLSETVAGVFFAWLLLSEVPRAIQFAGGALILIGVIVVRVGEPTAAQEASELRVLTEALPSS
jgi:drug/metabolite transporter (DMT)-like permease